MCQTWSWSAWTRALGREQVERRQLQVGERLDRPAVVAVGVDVPRRPCSRAVANRSSSVADVDAARRGLLERGDGSRRAPRVAAAPTAAYWLRSSSCAFADHGISSQSRQTQSVVELVPEPGRVAARRAPGRATRASSVAVVEERPAGAGVARRRCSSLVDAEAARAPRPRPGRRRRPPASPCASPRRRPAATPWRAVVGERLGRMLQQAGLARLVSHGDIVGGR